MLDHLEQPDEVCERSGVRNRTKLNRVVFTKLRIDVDVDYLTHVTSDEPTDPFATVVYLRRKHYPLLQFSNDDELRATEDEGEGGIPVWDTAFHSRVLVSRVINSCDKSAE